MRIGNEGGGVGGGSYQNHKSRLQDSSVENSLTDSSFMSCDSSFSLDTN